MNVPAIITELEARYPKKAIFKNNEAEPTEIICEVDPGTEHPDYSIAVAVIDKSIKHYHAVATETYKILRGTLRLYLNDEDEVVLYEGQTFRILPGQIHYAKGDATWVECESRPAWTPQDHIVV